MLAIAIPEYDQVEAAAAAVRQAPTFAEYLDAQEHLLEAMHAALDASARFWDL